MSGSGLFDFLITLVVLFGAGILFFIAIDKLAPDETMKKIAKVAVGVTFLVVFLVAVRAVLFGGGGGATISGAGIISFAIGLIVILVVMFLIDKALAFFAEYISPMLADIIRYVIFAVALIALLVLVDHTFFGAHYTSALGLGNTPQIMRQR